MTLLLSKLGYCTSLGTVTKLRASTKVVAGCKWCQLKQLIGRLTCYLGSLWRANQMSSRTFSCNAQRGVPEMKISSFSEEHFESIFSRECSIFRRLTLQSLTCFSGFKEPTVTVHFLLIWFYIRRLLLPQKIQLINNFIEFLRDTFIKGYTAFQKDHKCS